MFRLPPIADVRAVRLPRDGEEVWRERRHAERVEVDIGRRLEQRLWAFVAAGVWAPEVVLPHCPVF